MHRRANTAHIMDLMFPHLSLKKPAEKRGQVLYGYNGPLIILFSEPQQPGIQTLLSLESAELCNRGPGAISSVSLPLWSSSLCWEQASSHELQEALLHTARTDMPVVINLLTALKTQDTLQDIKRPVKASKNKRLVLSKLMHKTAPFQCGGYNNFLYHTLGIQTRKQHKHFQENSNINYPCHTNMIKTKRVCVCRYAIWYKLDKHCIVSYLYLFKQWNKSTYG